MSYQTMKNSLIKAFEQGNFLENYYKKKFNVEHIPILNLNNGTHIYITYPGIKTKVKSVKYNNVKRKHIIYDYRVNLRNRYIDTALTHVNIIIDLYNKQLQLGDSSILFDLLLDIARNGDDYNRKFYTLLDTLNLSPPSWDLLHNAAKVHKSLGKYYNTKANSWNYSLDELVQSVIWIVLQEDINYPMPRYEGRRMPFYRYMEALVCARDNLNNSKYNISLVMRRAMQHKRRPALWSEIIDYSQIKSLYKG